MSTRTPTGRPVGASPGRRCRSGVFAKPHRLLVSGLLALTTVLGTTAFAHASPESGEPAERPCDPGVFCTWSEADYTGRIHEIDLRTTNMEECVTLPRGSEVLSFVNRLGRPVTVYQGEHCSTTGDFTTYPGGTYVPEAPFVVRAIQIWTH